MAKQRTTFAKLQRERAKAAKKAEKQAARINGGKPPVTEEPVDVPEALPEVDEAELEAMSTVERLFYGKGRLSAPELMSMTEKIQRMHKRGDLDDDELEDAKLELLERIE